MTISPRDALTNDPQARFFLAPETPQQRQYEALRAYFVEKAPSHEVARRFGYTPGAFCDGRWENVALAGRKTWRPASSSYPSTKPSSMADERLPLAAPRRRLRASRSRQLSRPVSR